MTNDRTYSGLASLLEARLVRAEQVETAALMERLRPARERGHLTYDEFFAICYWKEPRQRMRRHWQRNSEPLDEPPIVQLTRRALATSDERARIETLLGLHGVGIPVASAILTILEPERYGVIDIRAWQVLHHYGAVSTNPDGRGFSIDEWLNYIGVLRDWAEHLAVSARRIEHTLYLYHWESKLTKITW